MRLHVEVRSAKSEGGDLIVEASGWERAAGAYEHERPISFRVRDTYAARRTYRVGRMLDIEIGPGSGRRPS